VIALRERIIDGKAPGLKKQSDLFTDAIGHPSRRCKRCSVLPLRGDLSPHAGGLAPARRAGERPTTGRGFNRLLQELAWDAVTRHP